ncbi:MAG: hypothetical protein B6D56_07575 [Candidatus Omnitrophica bacterium 4484_70.1]|nr:MAG: hypothetical protein B6D56_07575 [Candidatus Omnitrophica bacterium 4484_70.1]
MLSVYKYTFFLKFLTPATFPVYKGSVLRGAVITNFKNIVCINKKEKNCNSCFASESCVYKKIFEPVDKSNIPLPFILEPPYDKKKEYKKGERFEFNLLLIGKTSVYFPYFVIAVKRMENIGIGMKSRGKFILEKIKNSKRVIYTCRDEKLLEFLQPARIKRGKTADTLTLNFISPARIKIGGKLINNLPFSLLMKVLFRRISTLKKYYEDTNQDNIKWQEILKDAFFIKTISSNLKWYDWARYSLRQKTLMKLGGFVGKITYQGNFKKFLPFIRLGETIHIGKNTSFGLGKYVVEFSL